MAPFGCGIIRKKLNVTADVKVGKKLKQSP
jgi:hypothetical protein